jgi:hypothetical protein
MRQKKKKTQALSPNNQNRSNEATFPLDLRLS